MKNLQCLLIIITMFITGCSNATEVKRLSVKQMEYLDYTVEIASLHSEALILATEKLIEQAKIRIDLDEAVKRAHYERIMQNGSISSKDAKEITTRLTETTIQAVERKRRMDEDMKTIRVKTEELSVYLKKLKEVQVALDAYAHSESAGNAVLSTSLNHYDIDNLLKELNDMTPEIKRGVEEVIVLLNKID